MPDIISPGTGLSQLTDKSVIPCNNVITMEDILNGATYKLPDAGGAWGKGDDVTPSFIETGNDYKRKEQDLQRLLDISTANPNHEKWELKFDGGVKTFNSFESFLAFKRKMKEKDNLIKSVTRVKTAQSERDSFDIIESSLNSTFMVESINPIENILETGACFCVKKNYFITCAHVVKKYNKNTQDRFDLNELNNLLQINISKNGVKSEAKIIAINAPLDIAILYSEIDCNPFNLDLNFNIGDDIFAIGSPHGFENNVSFGNIGSLNRKIYNHKGAPNYIFIDLSVFAGNSGGPIIKYNNGMIVGMVTAIVSKIGEYGLNAGLSSNYISDFINKNVK